MWFCVFSSRESHFVVFPLSDIQNFRFAFSNSTNYFLKSVINDCIYLWIAVTLTNGCNYCEVAFILGCHLLLSKERLLWFKSIYVIFLSPIVPLAGQHLLEYIRLQLSVLQIIIQMLQIFY